MLIGGRKKYNIKEAFNVYKAYMAGSESIDNLLYNVIPLINITTAGMLDTSDMLVASQIATDVLEGVYKKFINNKIHCDSARKLTAFLSISIKREILDVLTKYKVIYKKEEFDYYSLCGLSVRGYTRDYKDLTYLLDYGYLIEDVKDEVLSRIRFSGREYEVCTYILDCILKDKHISTTFFSRRHKIKEDRIKFFVNYIRTVYRIVFEDKMMGQQ